MVCKSCEGKLSKVAASDPYVSRCRTQKGWGPNAHGPTIRLQRNRNVQGTLVASGSKAKTASGLASEGSSGGRRVGENKLLGSKNRYNPVGMKVSDLVDVVDRPTLSSSF